MKIQTNKTQHYNTNFTGYGKIVQMEHYKITDKALDDIFLKVSKEKQDLSYAISEVIKKDFGQFRTLCKDPIKTLNEFFDILRKEKYTKESLKNLFLHSNLTDQEGNIKDLPYRKIVINSGNDVIEDEFVADEIFDHGSREVKSLKGNFITVVNNPNAQDLVINAKEVADVVNSKIKSVKSEGLTNLINSEITEDVTCAKQFLAKNFSAKTVRAKSAKIEGEKNSVTKIITTSDMVSEGNLEAFLVKSENASAEIKGKNNNVKYTYANGDIVMENNTGESAIAIEGTIIGADSKVKRLSSKEFMNLENIEAETIESTNSDISILGQKNNVTQYIKAKGKVKAQNLSVESIFCKFFWALNDKIKIKGKLQTEQPYKMLGFWQIRKKAKKDTPQLSLRIN